MKYATDFPDKEEMLAPTAEGLSKLARYVLGMDYWLEYPSGRRKTRTRMVWDGEVRTTCGLVDWGPHRDMLQYMADDSMGNVLIMCSRGGLKTSGLQAGVIQSALRNPDVPQMIYMENYKDQTLETITAIKRQFESNEVLCDVFGDLVGKPWADDKLFWATRQHLDDRNPSLAGGATDKNRTGGHYGKIWIDDPTSSKQARSAEMMRKAIDGFEFLVPILNPGGRFVVTCTPYDDGDLSHHIRHTLSDQFQQLIRPCGMEAVSDGRGGYRLEGTPAFPHHSKEFLAAQLATMGAAKFNSQYALKTVNPSDRVFFREQFQEVPWRKAMSQMSAYVLCDTATSDSEVACFSVACLVALDHNDVAYVLDIRVGRWTPDRFGAELLGLIAEWQHRVRIVGTSMENVTMNRVYRALLERMAQDKNLRLNLIGIPRGIGAPTKNQRIRSLVPRVAAGHLKVVETISRTFHDRGEERVMWDATGFKGEDGNYPDGEFVDEFIRFRDSGGDQTNVDICDALADLQATDPRGRRFITPSPKPWRADVELTTGGGPEDWRKARNMVMRETLMERSQPHGRGSFWSQMARRARGSR